MLALFAADAPAAGEASARWQRNPADPRWVQGQIDMPMPATTVWRRLAEVASWPNIFSDISSFSVKSRSSDGAHWRVRFVSRTVGYGPHDFAVVLDASKRSGRVVLQSPGVRAGAYFSVAVMDEQDSRLSYSAFVERSGFFGLFLSESELRAYQERLVQLNLGDLEKAFGASRSRP
jgi:hypothetical protein